MICSRCQGVFLSPVLFCNCTNPLFYTLRSKGSKKALLEGLRFYPEPFASENPFLRKGSSRVLCKTTGSSKNLLIQKTLSGRKCSSRIVESMGIRRSSFSNIQMFSHVSNSILKCRYILNPLNQFILLVFCHSLSLPSFHTIQ